MDWIYLAPHFDDAAFSCGGLIREQVSNGEKVQVWTICAGEIPPGGLSAFAEEHHQRWQTGREAVARRRLEDMRSCEIMGADYCYFPIPDCIYRRGGDNYWGASSVEMALGAATGKHLYLTLAEILGPVHPAEERLVLELAEVLSGRLPPGAELVCPMAIGGHVDHRLTRAAVESLEKSMGDPYGKPNREAPWYYADFPYVVEEPGLVARLGSQGWKDRRFEITAAGLDTWYEAIVAHSSQISTFWDDLPALRKALEGYVQEIGGAALWKPEVKTSQKTENLV